jgi:hypothetical protein
VPRSVAERKPASAHFYRASFTVHVPGVQVIEMALAVASPVQLWGPLKVILPVSLTLPLKPLKGAANDSAQAVSVTVKLMPTSEESQCAVTFQVPLRSGQPALAAPALPPLPASAPEPPDELELQAPKSRTAAHRARSIRRW